jgi:hypothetical protein
VAEDDKSISDRTRLYRRLHPDQVVWDANEGRVRASSAAFKDEYLSVHLGDELERIGETTDFVLQPYPQHSLSSITAELARAHEQALRRTPTEDDPTHGEAVGRKRGSRSQALAKGATLEIVRREFLRPDVRARLADDSEA